MKGLDPDYRSNLTITHSLYLTAICKGVQPSESQTFKLAPR